MRVGIEVGGTFTDLVAVDGGEIRVVKVSSTPRSPDIGAFSALGAGGIEASAVTDLVHGSTVATNAILERRGALIAFVATAGFRDILFMQRHDRRNIYDLHYAKPVPPVRRRDCFEVAERIDASGAIIHELDEAAVQRDLIPALTAGGYAAVAICLLSAYAAPAHEQRVKALIAAALPGLLISVDFGTWLTRRASQAPLDQGGWSCTDSLLPGLDLWDPASHLGLRGNGLAAWPGWPTSAALESLRDKWFLAPDEAARKAICRDIQMQAWQDVPYIPTGRWKDVTAYSAGLSGVLNGMPLFYNIQKA